MLYKDLYIFSLVSSIYNNSGVEIIPLGVVYNDTYPDEIYLQY